MSQPREPSRARALGCAFSVLALAALSTNCRNRQPVASLPMCTSHVASPSGPDAEPPAVASGTRWIDIDGNGNPQSIADAAGNRIPDFSFAGYRGGGVALPVVSAPSGAVSLRPSGGDDTAMIQAAIDAVSQLAPDENGFRGAVVLGAGTFALGGTLRISAGGVVLRGQGEDPATGTTLRATGMARTVINVGTAARPMRASTKNAAVTDDYVPVGANVLHVDSPSLFSPGMSVIVQRPQTANWICQLGMDAIPQRSDGKPVVQWAPGDGLEFDRTVTKVVGDAVTLDVPLTNALERSFAPSLMWPYQLPERIESVGIEQLRGEADFADGLTNYLASLFVEVGAVKDGWLAHVTGDGFGNGVVVVGASAVRITVADTSVVRPVIPTSTIADPAGFTIAGQQSLVLRGHVQGERLHALISESDTAGPNVVLDLTVTGSDVDVSAHQRWAVGFLIDRAVITNAGAPSGIIAVENRGNDGTGQGWAGANWLIWNATAAKITVDSPPTARNWVIGGVSAQLFGTGEYSSVGTMLTPASLYLAQLRARLGDSAVSALGY